MRVLIVEDEAALRERLTEQLHAHGYAVDVAANGRDGRFAGDEYPIDLAIVDLGLPDTPGVEVIRAWRAGGRKFPILILTARGRWEDKVSGLEAGADDYLVKPFHVEELLARIRALLRRSAGFATAVLKCGPIELDPARQALAVNGVPVEVTAFEFKVIEYLMLHAGQVVSKSELTDHIYEEDQDRDSNVLEVLVGRLRRKLDPDRTLNPIETLRGRGYVLRFDREQ
ncbi:MAG: response regulator [Gammaproteobacteria bacterium]